MLELKVAAVQSFALLINKFREGAQAGPGRVRGDGWAWAGEINASWGTD